MRAKQTAERRGLSLELLVHGVGGTTPQEMLGDPRTTRVTGDHTAAIHRRGEDADAEQRPRDYAEKPVPEAYCWSNLTSGNSARALWLLLLPFMVVNLAHWMRPDSGTGSAGPGSRAVRAHGLIVRLLALSLTVLLVAGACEVALDLVAWQCAGNPECTRDRAWLGFLTQHPEGGGWWSQPGRRLALAALLPAALTALMWWLSHRTWSAYESQQPLRRPIAEDEPAANGRPALCLPGFWYGRRLVSRLRAAHTAAGFLTVAAALTAAATRHDREPGGPAALDVLGWALATVILLGACGVVYVVCRRGSKQSEPDDRVDRFAVRALPGAAIAVAGLAAVYACWSRPGWASGATLPGDETFGVLAVVQGALAAALAVTGLLLYRERRVPRTALTGLAPAAVAMLACGLGGLMTGGVAQRVGDWLDGSGSDGLIAGPPVLLTWQASAIPVLLLVVLALLGWFSFQLVRRAQRLREQVDADYPGELPDESRSRRIGGAIARAELTDRAPWLVGTVALIALLLGGVAVLGTLLTGKTPGGAADGAPALIDGAADTVQALGSWMIGFAFLAFLTWGRRAYRDASARRTIGILWDVGTFWPRAAHPFAPPCYAERAVPDLAWRMATWTRQQPGGRLVISGHSQGSVLAASAAWQLDPVTRRQIALLTYGSPLERLYGRWFPAYFGPAALRTLHGDVDCWRNLWRSTDPIGGAVLPGHDHPGGSCRVDQGPLRDPLVYGRTDAHPLPEPILGHSDYQADPAFGAARDALLAHLTPPTEAAGQLPAQERRDADGDRAAEPGEWEGPAQGESGGRSSG
ncbi:hypothetical protein E0L36_17335 [Streptomyces sp. AJS327]|uniref:hypothetical protein n=1 Tax=Streptomyces sp. AJS327 TaxID=2545265 RepID=UPI0015DEC561|nr:hypothetical protein [Streptomyces sp. AJS327]MBA0052584.1 hypothetical protein [Streptomyces sp. AJS327]